MARRTTRLAAAFVAALALARPTLAEEPAEAPLAEAEEGLRELLVALELLIAAIPQYAMPEVLENGDIVIRRIQPPADADDANGDGVDETAI